MIEYAELKDTSSENIIKTFCQYKAQFEIDMKYVDRKRDAGVPQKELAQEMQSLQEYVDMLTKIRSALRNPVGAG